MKKLSVSKLSQNDFKEIDKIFREIKKTDRYGTPEDICNCVFAFCEWVDFSGFESIEFDISYGEIVDKTSMH